MYKNLLIFFGLLAFAGCNRAVGEFSEDKELFVVEIDERNYRLDQRIEEEDTDISAIVAPYKAQLDGAMNEVLTSSPFELVKSRPNGSLNNWFADLLMAAANEYYAEQVEFAIQNYGGIRVPSIAQGDVLVRHIYEMMPFDNKISIMKVKGNIVRLLMEQVAASGGWAISHSVRMTADDRTLTGVTINGEALDDDREYVFALPDYIANGNDDCGFLIDQNRTDLDLLIRDGIILYLKAHPDGVRPSTEKRFFNE